MDTISLTEAPTRAELRGVHELLAAASETDPLLLKMPARLRFPSPLGWGLVAQAIITWGLTSRRTVLELPASVTAPSKLRAALRDSEHVLIAVLLARQVVTSDGTDVTRDAARLADAIVGERNVLPATTSAAKDFRASIVLPSFIPRLSVSPELHAISSGEWGIEEEARTLYHDLWRERDKPVSLRDPLFNQGEEAIGDNEEAHVARKHWPTSHPSRPRGPFQPLGARMLTPQRAAADLVAANRVQPKPVTDEIGEVLFELVQNTEWHTAGRPGGKTGRNLRLVSFARFTYTAKDLPQVASVDRGFADYLAVAMQLPGGRTARSITVGIATIIDSGIGLARSAAALTGEQDLVNAQNEVSYLIRALQKTVRASRRGMGNIGLPNVQQLLTNLRGFMSIRTGRVEIQRDFISKEFSPIDPESPRQLKEERYVEWVSVHDEDASVGVRIGTDATVVVPLDYEVNA